MTLTRIKHNRAQCAKCLDIIESTHRHDFVGCGCGAIAVDGGKDYLKRVGPFDVVLELSEYEDVTEGIQVLDDEND